MVQSPENGEPGPKHKRSRTPRKADAVAREAADHPRKGVPQDQLPEGNTSEFKCTVAVVGGKQVGLLSHPDVNVTTGESFEVVARLISNVDDRVYLRLASKPAWVSTRSRKDITKLVLAPSGPSALPLEPAGSKLPKPRAD